jgi:filamentous hemagglutinin family protein
MKAVSVSLGLLNSLLASMILLPSMTQAQVISDGTTNTIVNSKGNDFTIINGIEKGNNLFHSFSNFSVPTNASAKFDLVNTPNITTIFSRITGGNISNIDGLIQTINSNNPVSLFLMNPNGIVFGKNASLDISGSFVGTTANSIKFSDGVEFGTVNVPATPLLTMSVPVGLQMGINSRNIIIKSTGHQISLQQFSPVSHLEFNNTPVGLQVSPGNTLALVGANINLESGILTAPGGRIELGAVQPQNHQVVVGLSPDNSRWALSYGTIGEFGDIQLRNQALVNASGVGNGGIQIQGKNLLVQDGSALVWENRGTQGGIGIHINTTDTVQLLRQGNKGFDSSIYSDAKGIGTTGDMAISTGRLMMHEGAIITSRTFSSADGGNITLNAADIYLWTPNEIRNTIAARTLGSGQGGNIKVNTQRLAIHGGGQISSNVQNADGVGGNVVISATEYIDLISASNVIGGQAQFTASTIGGKGNAGTITVSTDRLTLRDGSNISSSTFGDGNGGTVTINASSSIEVTGMGIDLNKIFQGSEIRSAAILYPPTIRRFFNLPSTVTGAAGSIVINTSSLKISDKGGVSVRHDDSGDAGNLFINAKQITLNNQGSITANTASGKGGDINLNLESSLILRNNSLISTESKGEGTGGNITIISPIIVGLKNSDIIANAVKGRGGDIQIGTQGIIGLEYRNLLNPREISTNDITASSQFNVNGVIEINNIGIDPSSGLIELPVELTDPSQKISTGCSNTYGNSFVATGRGGIPENPTEELRSDRPWSDTRDFHDNHKKGNVKKGNVTTQIPTSPEILVQANSWRQNHNGQIELISSESLENSQHPLGQTALNCAGVPN